MRGAALLAVLAACGRLGFEPLPADGERGDADAGLPVCGEDTHDEDGDTITDGCDVCPIDPDPAQQDQDGDGVGDACDPHVSVPGDVLAYFDPFTSQREEWDSNLPGNLEWGGDSVLIDARTGYTNLNRPFVYGNDTVAIRGNVLDTAGPIQQVAVMDVAGMAGAPNAVYCEMYDDGAMNAFSLTQTENGTDFFGVANETLTESLTTPRAFRLSITREGTRVDCATDFPGPTGRLTGTPTAGLGGQLMRVDTNGVALQVSALVQYHAP